MSMSCFCQEDIKDESLMVVVTIAKAVDKNGGDKKCKHDNVVPNKRETIRFT